MLILQPDISTEADGCIFSQQSATEIYRLTIAFSASFLVTLQTTVSGARELLPYRLPGIQRSNAPVDRQDAHAITDTHQKTH